LDRSDGTTSCECRRIHKRSSNAAYVDYRPSITITGDLSAGGPLRIAGRGDGTISIPDYSLTIDDAGRVNADVEADTVIVGGAVTVKRVRSP